MLKKVIASSILAGAIAIGSLVGAGSASASSQSFLNAINANGWTETVPGYLLDEGYQACAIIGQGYGEYAAVSDVYAHTNLNTTWGEAQWFVNTAQRHLCR